MKFSFYMFLITIGFLSMISCNSSEPNPTEEKINKEINAIYMSQTTFEDIFDGTLDGIKDVDVKNVYVSQSAILDTIDYTIARNNIAAIVYENLTPEERKLYEYIGIDITRTNKENAPFSFPTVNMEKQSTSKALADRFANAIQNESYEDLKGITEEGSSKRIKEYITEITTSAGKMINYSIYGMGEGEHDAKTIYSYYGQFVYANTMTQNFYVTLYEGEDSIAVFSISPLDIDPIDLQ